MVLWLLAAAPASRCLGGPPAVVICSPRARDSLVTRGERLRVKAIVLSAEPPREVTLNWRPLREGSYARVRLEHVARGVYRVTLPPEAMRADFEYFIEVGPGGDSPRFPVTAPALNQTVVVADTEIPDR